MRQKTLKSRLLYSPKQLLSKYLLSIQYLLPHKLVQNKYLSSFRNNNNFGMKNNSTSYSFRYYRALFYFNLFITWLFICTLSRSTIGNISQKRTMFSFVQKKNYTFIIFFHPAVPKAMYSAINCFISSSVKSWLTISPIMLNHHELMVCIKKSEILAFTCGYFSFIF